MFELIGRAQAAIPDVFPDITGFIIDTDTGLTDVAMNVVKWIILLAGLIAVVYLIWGGLLYITAGGDAEKATKGRTAIINAIIGIVIILLAFVIVYWVGRILTSATTY